MSTMRRLGKGRGNKTRRGMHVIRRVFKFALLILSLYWYARRVNDRLKSSLKSKMLGRCAPGA